MVEWVLIHLHTRLLLWEEIDVIQYPYCWCESSGISWRCRTLAYQKLWRGGSLATKVPPQKIEPLSSGCIRHPCWLMIGSRVVQPHILAMIRMRGFMDSLFTNKWHFRIWALWNMLLTSPSRPFASICTAGGDDDNDFMRRGRFRDNRWVLRPEYLAGRGVWDSCGATLHNGATVETAQFRANLGEKGEPSGFTNFNAFDRH